MVKKKNIKIKMNKGKNIKTKAQPVVWNPFEMIPGDVNRLFTMDPWEPGSLLRHWGWRRPWGGLWLGRDMKEIPIDIIDTGDKFKIVAEMPGVNKDDIEVTVTPRNISICGKIEREETEEDEGYIRRERSYSTLCRNMTFPAEVNPDEADATLKDGILEVTINKKEPTKSNERRITVK
ncbi:MAG: Hsp20/alpha crystallin family protein [Candidatus Thermoplasmatota archaeon]